MLLAGTTRLLEAAIRKALQYDPGTRASLRRLEGRTLCVEVIQPEFTLFITSQAGEAQIRIASDQAPEATLRGSLMQLASLPRRNLHNLHDTGVELLGNFDLVQQWQAILKDLDIDWEEPLNQITGDLVGHPLAQGVRAVARKVSRDARRMPGYVSEYLSEEARVLIGTDEAEVFYEDVDDLRSRTDRLEARLQRLETPPVLSLEPPSPQSKLPPAPTRE